MTNPTPTPESMGQDLARDIEAAGVKGPHFDVDKGTASLPLVAVLFAHDQRKTHPDKVPTKEELRQKLVGTLSTREKEY